MKVWRAYRALSPEQRKIVDTKLVEAKSTPAEFITLLEPVALFDAKIGSGAALGCLSLLGPIVVVVSLSFGFQAWTPGIIATLVISVLATLLVWTMRYFNNKTDVSDNLRDTLLPLLKLLSDDVARGEPMELRLDLRLPTDKAKKTGTSKPYAKGVHLKLLIYVTCSTPGVPLRPGAAGHGLPGT